MKVTIIGAGVVGRTLAYSLLLGGGIRELLLVGRRRAIVEAGDSRAPFSGFQGLRFGNLLHQQVQHLC